MSTRGQSGHRGAQRPETDRVPYQHATKCAPGAIALICCSGGCAMLVARTARRFAHAVVGGIRRLSALRRPETGMTSGPTAHLTARPGLLHTNSRRADCFTIRLPSGAGAERVGRASDGVSNRSYWKRRRQPLAPDDVQRLFAAQCPPHALLNH